MPLDGIVSFKCRLMHVKIAIREQCWRSGESTGLPPIWPGFDYRIERHMWVTFVGSLLCSERFLSGTPAFPSHQKATFDLISCLAN